MSDADMLQPPTDGSGDQETPAGTPTEEESEIILTSSLRYYMENRHPIVNFFKNGIDQDQRFDRQILSS